MLALLLFIAAVVDGAVRRRNRGGGGGGGGGLGSVLSTPQAGKKKCKRGLFVELEIPSIAFDEIHILVSEDVGTAVGPPT